MIRPTRVPVILAAVALAPAGPAAAADRSLDLDLAARTEYNDNVSFSSSDREEDVILSVNPALAWSRRTERSTLATRLGIDLLDYMKVNEYDTEHYNGSLSGSRNLSERFSLKGGANIIKDTTLESELEETGIVWTREDRNRYSGNIGLSYKTTELATIDLTYSRSRTEYDSQGNVDYDTDQVDLSYSHPLRNQRSSVLARTYFSRTDSDVSTIETAGVLGGMSHAFSETLILTAYVGIRRTETEYSVMNHRFVPDPEGIFFYRGTRSRLEWVKGSENESSWGGLADVSVERKGEITSIRGGVRRDMLTNSLGEPIEQDRLYAAADTKILERLTAGLSGSLSLTTSDGKISEEDNTYYSLGANLRYRLFEKTDLTCGYEYARFDNKLVDDTYDRNRIFLNLRYLRNIF